MIEPASLLAWTALALIVTISPGPDTVLIAAHSARGGLRAGLSAVAGIAAGGIWHASLFGFGLLSALVAVPALFLAVKIAGALYLAWLGLGLLRNALRPAAPVMADAPEAIVARPTSELGAPFMQALLTNALNPKVALFYLAALPQFASGPHAPAIGALLIAIHGVLGAVWLSGIAFAASRARKVSWNRTFVRWLEGAIGVFFVGVAARLALAQAR